jgi:Leucine-rich repeat (LRR) protein
VTPAVFPPVAESHPIQRLAGGAGKPLAGRLRHIIGALAVGSRRRDRDAGPPEQSSGDAVMSRRLIVAIVIGLAITAASISLLKFRPRTIVSQSGPDAGHLQAEAEKVRSGKSIFVDARNHPDIRDKDLEILLCLTNLRIVNLDTSPITDEGLKVLARVPSIDTVSVSRTEITDAGLAELGTLTDMNELRLDATAITDAGLAHLKAFPRLRVLSLYQTGITDAGMVHLKHLTMLQRLSLDETLVSDAGLKELSALPNLRELFVWRTQVTDAGINDLKAKLPKLKINRGSD